MPSTELGQAEVYYWPQFTIDGSTEVDNALFFSPIQGFVALLRTSCSRCRCR